MLYTIKYRRPGQKAWDELKGVKGDTILLHQYDELTFDTGSTTPQAPVSRTRVQQSLPVRVIIMNDETRFEIPMDCEIWFSNGRFQSIQEKMSKEAGQPIQVNSN